MSFQALFYPKSIAVIGASRKIKTVGNDIVKNLVTQGFKGNIYPINPSADSLYGLKVLHSVSEIPGPVDLAVVAVPAPYVSQVVIEAAQKGARAAVVISAGCKEIGNVELERQLTEVCRQHEVSLVGPNCLGIINPEISMNASFAGLMPKTGNVAFISQSGALCTAVLDYAQDLCLGFSKFLSIGNKADINELQLIKYFAEDPNTEVIAMYVEQLENAQEIIRTVKEMNRGAHPKPIIVLKSGRTAAGASAIASHTGSLSGGDAAYNALFAQTGIIRANSVSELFDYAQIFSKTKLSAVKNVTIITNAGGPGVLTTDEVIDNGLELAKLSDETVTALKAILPQAASTKNPVDILGDAVGERYKQALDLVVADPNTDGVIVLLTPQSMTEIEVTAKAVVQARHNSQKPIVVSFMGQATVNPGVEIMKQAGVITTTFPEPAARSLGTMGKFHAWTKQANEPVLHFDDVDKAAVAEIFAKAKAKGQTSFPEAEAIEILRAYNFPTLRSAQAATPEEAKQVATEFGSKLAMKIVSPDILHKSDVGGVQLNVTVEAIEAEYADMMKTVSSRKPEAKLEGVLLVEMAPANGTEVILGINKVAGLGTMVMVGLGGIYVEVLKDVSFSIAPVTNEDVSRMLSSLRSAKIFEGVRGQQPLDKKMLAECVGRLSQLVTDFPEIIELDINPLLVLPQGEGVKILDARVVIE